MNWKPLHNWLFGKPRKSLPRKRSRASAAVETLEVRKLLTADLRGVAVQAPAEAYRGSAVNLVTQVANDGDATSPAFTVRFYASRDATITSGDVLLKMVNRPGFATQTVQEWSETITLPSNFEPGEWHFGALLDPYNYIRESDESNNAVGTTTPTVVSNPPPVDLRAAGLGTPYYPKGGATVSLSTTVANLGSAASGTFQVSYYLSTDNRVTTDDRLLKTVTVDSIAARGQRRWNESITLPDDLPTASYYLGIVVDPANETLEAQETNNTFATGTFRMTAPPVIDLQATAVQAPPEAYRGYPVNVTTTVSNLGTSPSGTFKINFYLTSTDSVGATDLLLKSVTRTTLAGGGVQTWSEALSFPATLAEGTYRIGVVVDPTNAIRETDESNGGLASAEIVIAVPPPDDLRAVSLSAPSASLGGSTVSLSTTVANAGTAASGSFQVSYYLSTDNRITTDDVLLKSAAVASIALRGQRQWYESITLPANLPTGNYYLGFLIDPANEIRELVETNNTRVTGAVRITAPPIIDLEATSFTAPAEARGGSSVAVQTTVTNLGSSPSGTFKVNYYLSSNEVVGTSDLLLKSVTRSTLAGGAAQSWTETIALPANLALGTYRIGVIVDPTNAIRETNESNNQARSAGTFTVLPPANAKLGFDISLNFKGLTNSQIAVFRQAAARWSEIIQGDLPDLTYYGVFIDDVQINASAKAIDGVGKVLGQAGPTRYRSGTSIPFIGVMEFDSADLASMESKGTLFDVILHEMGHVLGIGSLWSAKGLVTGRGGVAPLFTGKQATAAYNEAFGATATGVPVEGNVSGVGSRDTHWSESVFRNEIMTPYLSGSTRPISRVTVASLADLGYLVNLDAADAFVPTWATPTASASAGTTGGAGLSQLIQPSNEESEGPTATSSDGFTPCACGLCQGAKPNGGAGAVIAQTLQAMRNSSVFAGFQPIEAVERRGSTPSAEQPTTGGENSWSDSAAIEDWLRSLLASLPAGLSGPFQV